MCVNTEFRENEKFIKGLFACTVFSEDKKISSRERRNS